ncbi:MAG: serine/threonine-protein kinase [Thermoanaerobaculia bacterium]
MPFFCIACKSSIEPDFKACPFCGEPITDFLRQYLETPIDGKYQILGRLGVGGMGEVYKVLHLHLNSVRVIKMMRASLMKEEVAHERFTREARLATRIHHPNVATLFDFSTLPDGSYYMVWEYIEGTNLTEVLRTRGCVSPRYAAIIGREALLGLDAIHRAGVVHRDVSPENLMITRDEEGVERVKIIDLGIAKQWGDAVDDKTKTGMFVGKWKYCSPEHLGMLKEGERIDGRADIYSFGIVMYEMLTGAAPFIADTPHRYLLAHATETPKPLTVTNPGVSPSSELEAIVFRALEKDRNKRYPTAREMARAIEAVIPSLPEVAAVPIAPDYLDETTAEHQAPGGASTTLAATRAAIEAGETVRSQDLIATVETSSEREAALPESGSEEVTSEWRSFGTKTLAGEPQIAHAAEPQISAKFLLWGGAIAAVVLIAVVLAGMMIRHNTTAASMKEPAEAASIVAPTPVKRAPLSINAFPWAEIESIREASSGKAIPLPEKPVTPAVIDLPPGRYEIVVRNPAAANDVTRTVEVTAGGGAVTFQLTDPSRASLPDFGGSR